jgi:hypothetical protein
MWGPVPIYRPAFPEEFVERVNKIVTSKSLVSGGNLC